MPTMLMLGGTPDYACTHLPYMHMCFKSAPCRAHLTCTDLVGSTVLDKTLSDR
jgi:hypothetical protein